jgi:hypothetical protein
MSNYIPPAISTSSSNNLPNECLVQVLSIMVDIRVLWPTFPHALPASDPRHVFDELQLKVNDHITKERIYHATAKLQALADGVHPSLLTRATGSAYVSINEDSCHPSSAYLDDDLSPQQVYFRTYCRNLPPDSPPSLSPTPPPERDLSPSRPVFQQEARTVVEATRRRDGQGGREKVEEWQRLGSDATGWLQGLEPDLTNDSSG